MKLPLAAYRRLDGQLRAAWREITRATDTPESRVSLDHLAAAVRTLAATARRLWPDELCTLPDGPVIRHLAGIYREKLVGSENTPATIDRLIARCTAAAEAVDSGSSGTMERPPDALIVNEAIPALWRLLRGLRGELRRRRPRTYYGIVTGQALGLGVLAWIVYVTLRLAIPWGATVIYYRDPELKKIAGWGVEFSLSKDYGERRPALFAGRHNWSARWQGWLRVPRDGRYSFYAQSDDGLRFWLDGKLLIDNWREQDWLNSGRGTAVELTRGRHRYRLEYFNRAGRAALRVRWAGGGIPDDTVLGAPYLYKY